MLNIHLDDINEFKDVVTFNNQKIFKKFGVPDKVYLKIANLTSRENSRTPVQWDESANAGFTTGTPWFKVNPNYKDRKINVADEENDPDSILNFYRKLFSVRQADKLYIYGDYKEYYPKSRKLYCYERSYKGRKALVMVSFSTKDQTFNAPEGFDLTKGELVLCNYDDASATADSCTLRPYEARVYYYG